MWRNVPVAWPCVADFSLFDFSPLSFSLSLLGSLSPKGADPSCEAPVGAERGIMFCTHEIKKTRY